MRNQGRITTEDTEGTEANHDRDHDRDRKKRRGIENFGKSLTADDADERRLIKEGEKRPRALIRI